MRKIPTVFKRDPDNPKHVLAEVTPGCEWVLAGEGIPTRKYDGTCVMFDGSAWWARREVRPGKPTPQVFMAISTDPNTGKTVGWEPMAQSPFARFHAEALADEVIRYGEPLPPGTYELCGPKINGNPERLDEHALVAHSTAEEIQLPEPSLRSFDEIKRAVLLFRATDGTEGIVWHHPDGRMAKVKARDFPREG